MFFLLWLLFSVLLHSIVYWVMSDNVIASSMTFANIIITISFIIAKYTLYRKDMEKNNRCKLFSKSITMLPLYTLLAFSICVLLKEIVFKDIKYVFILSPIIVFVFACFIITVIFYRDFVDNKLLVGLKVKQNSK